MKQHPNLPDSGVHIDNLLTMALLHRSWNRNRIQLILLALLGAVSTILTFLTMFSPPCNVPAVLTVTAAVTVYFCWHAEHQKGSHISLIFFLLGYVLFFYWQRMRAANGMVYMMNAVFQTIYMTDWLYFEPDASYSPASSTTVLICFILIPVLWLLSYAVMRYQNFFLSLLVTFPFIEVGFFFGIAPEHFPMAGIFAFWCGMGAVQLAGSGAFQKSSNAGFMRRKNTFFPVSGMRFLLTECAGTTAAVSVLALFLLGDMLLGAMHYERPEKIKQLRSDFQDYAASIDWSDLSTLIPPFLSDQHSGGMNSKNKIELGRKDQQKFENTAVSSIVFSEMPQNRIYLRYSCFNVYDHSEWSRMEGIYDTEDFLYFEESGYYPPEFLYYTFQPFGLRPLDMSLYHANKELAQCVPYGYQKSKDVICENDDIKKTKTAEYTAFGDVDYEKLLRTATFSPVSVADLLSQCRSEHQEALAQLALGYTDQTILMPYGSQLTSQYFSGSSLFSPETAEAALLSACGYQDFVREHYLTVPESKDMQIIRSRYADLLDGFDAQSASPAEIILELQLLRERLCSQVTYSLAPGKTPPDSDFVSYFLLHNKKGYCTHYATSAALLARMAGIPARYCEGYLVDNTQVKEEISNDTRVYTVEILDSNAHAWCEVFIEGIGWIPFEFTYTYFTPPPELEEEEETILASETYPEEESLTEAPTDAAATEHTNDTSAATTATEAPTEPVTEPETPASAPSCLPILVFGAILLLCIAGFVLARRYALNKRKKSFTQADRQDAAQSAWRWLLTLMRFCGADTEVRTTVLLAEEAVRHCSRYLRKIDIREAIDIGTKLRYSPYGISDEELDCILKTADALAQGIYRSSDLFKKFTLKWIRHFV